MAGSIRIDFLKNAGAGNGAAMYFAGGKLAFMANATFGGGNVKLQMQLPDAAGTWADVTGSTLSAAGFVVLEIPAGQYRAVVTTATAAYASGVSVPTSTR